jgi:mannose-6-phosphate isomerase-like protein (cupin superfamily)
MIKKLDELRHENAVSLRGGKGTTTVIHLLERDQFHEKGRLFAHNILKPGNSIGYHKHEGDFEAYYFIKGEGTFDDNGIKSTVKAGDLALIAVGESHGIENTGKEDLEFIALVLFD